MTRWVDDWIGKMRIKDLRRYRLLADSRSFAKREKDAYGARYSRLREQPLFRVSAGKASSTPARV